MTETFDAEGRPLPIGETDEQGPRAYDDLGRPLPISEPSSGGDGSPAYDGQGRPLPVGGGGEGAPDDAWTLAEETEPDDQE